MSDSTKILRNALRFTALSGGGFSNVNKVDEEVVLIQNDNLQVHS